MSRTITIVVRDGNNFDVHEGERYCDRLCWEEMLGQIATLTHPQINAARFPMQTPEQHQERNDRYRAMRQRNEEQKPVDEADALERFINDWGSRAGEDDTLLPPQQQSSVIRSAMETLAVARRTNASTSSLTTEKP